MVNYELDPAHTNVGFTAKHLAVSTIHGQFNRWEGQFEGPDDSLTGVRGTLKVEVASLSTRNDQRDTHLRSADFFDAEKYPYITFKVTGIEKVDEDNYKLRGDLTINLRVQLQHHPPRRLGHFFPLLFLPLGKTCNQFGGAVRP